MFSRPKSIEYDLECGDCGHHIGSFVRFEDFGDEPRCCPDCLSMHLREVEVFGDESPIMGPVLHSRRIPGEKAPQTPPSAASRDDPLADLGPDVPVRPAAD